MIVEYAQILCTVHRVVDGEEEIEQRYIKGTLPARYRKQRVWKLKNKKLDCKLYKATHVNHPSTKWARFCEENYQWLYEMWLELMKEYHMRYERHHKCEELIEDLARPPKNINKTEKFCPPWRAMPDEYKVDKSEPDYTVKSYRAYLLGAKERMLSWKKRLTPDWATK
jgi:hypothetical protein